MGTSNASVHNLPGEKCNRLKVLQNAGTCADEPSICLLSCQFQRLPIVCYCGRNPEGSIAQLRFRMGEMAVVDCVLPHWAMVCRLCYATKVILSTGANSQLIAWLMANFGASTCVSILVWHYNLYLLHPEAADERIAPSFLSRQKARSCFLSGTCLL